jgi:ribosomal protein S18 acetylase RimI-like enzyme
MIITTSKKHLANVALVHMNAFPNSISSKLGQKYCIKMLEWYLISSNAFLFHFEIDSKIVGYCGGKVAGSHGSGSTTVMLQYTFLQAIKSMILRPWLFFNQYMITNYSIIINNILIKLKIKKKRSQYLNKKEINNFIEVGLVVIGVKKNKQGLGYGSKLLIEFEKRSKSLGARKINLSVKSSNTTAIKSYSRNGWELEKSDIHLATMYKLI